jgi:hypothetical protein
MFFGPLSEFTLLEIVHDLKLIENSLEDGKCFDCGVLLVKLKKEILEYAQKIYFDNKEHQKYPEKEEENDQIHDRCGK